MHRGEKKIALSGASIIFYIQCLTFNKKLLGMSKENENQGNFAFFHNSIYNL